MKQLIEVKIQMERLLNKLINDDLSDKERTEIALAIDKLSPDPYWSASKMQINWSEQALSEVENIVNYIAEHNVVAALEMDDLIRNSVMILKQMPRAGRYGRVANTRELVIHRNYIVIYEIGLDSITILNVKHASQKYP